MGLTYPKLPSAELANAINANLTLSFVALTETESLG